MRLWIASDHAGFDLKLQLKKGLSHHQWEDLGPKEISGALDYPDYALELGKRVQENEDSLGILVCGSGTGMAIAANKIRNIRAAVVENPVSARLAREHNHVNVLCLGSRFTAPAYALEIVQAWLEAVPSIEERHLNRLKKLSHAER